jgi:hypothetical protein
LAGRKTRGEGLRKFAPEKLTNDERGGRLLVRSFTIVSWEQITALLFAQAGPKSLAVGSLPFELYDGFPVAANDRGLIDLSIKYQLWLLRDPKDEEPRSLNGQVLANNEYSPASGREAINFTSASLPVPMPWLLPSAIDALQIEGTVPDRSDLGSPPGALKAQHLTPPRTNSLREWSQSTFNKAISSQYGSMERSEKLDMNRLRAEGLYPHVQDLTVHS